MDLAEWRAAVAAGDSEPPPDPQIPADYLQRPRRQPSVSAESGLPPPYLPPSPTSFPRAVRKRVAEVAPHNYPAHKRQRVLCESSTTGSRSQPSRSPSKMSRRLAAKEGKDTGDAADYADYTVDLHATPRPGRAGRNLMSLSAAHEAKMPQLGLTPSASDDRCRENINRSISSTSSLTASTRSKARSHSPTKRMIDLRVAEKTVISRTANSPLDVPEDVRELYKEVRKLARVPRGVLPQEVEHKVQCDAGGDLDDLDVLVAREPSIMNEEELLDEFKALRGIRDSTLLCTRQHLHEPSWNERVHCRMLEQAVLGSPNVEYQNITTARVIKGLVSDNKFGEALKQKMIDYAITLRVSGSEVISRLAASPSPLHRTINPSDYSPLCYNPIAISIETKSPNGGREHGEVQLSTWAMAHFNRLRLLTQNPVSITLPLILISDEHWKLLFACDLEEKIHIIDAVDFGTTADIIGCYTILKVLRLLVEWATGTFSEWFKDGVLAPE